MPKQEVQSQIDVFTLALEAHRTFSAKAMHFNATLMTEVATINSEMFTFFQDRVGRDLEMTRALGQCGSVEEALIALGAFQQKAVEDYSDEAEKLSDLNRHVSEALIDEVSENGNAGTSRKPRSKAA